METKTCTKCNTTKPMFCFNKTKRSKDGYNSWCKLCHKHYRQSYNKNTKEYRSKYSKEYRSKVKPSSSVRDSLTCTKCGLTKSTSEFHKRKDSPSGYRSHCKECIRKSNNIRNNTYRSKREFKDKRNEYMRERRNDSTFRITENLRRRILSALNGESKSKPTLELLGCSIEYFKKHLQQTAITNGYVDFDIETFSGKDYHIDHINPCSKFDLSNPKDQQICFHYSNMQILTSEYNLSKSDKLISEI